MDSQGNGYVAGVTSSPNFPLLNAVQSSLLGSLDAFVAKVSASGTLVYSTYLGGSGVDVGNAIAVDASGGAYVVGYSYSTDLPVTANALQTANAGACDAFLAKLSAAGPSLAYLSYLGGNSSDTATAVALDTSGNVYIAGWTLSTNFTLFNPYQSTNAGNYGAFVTKISFALSPVVVGVTPNSGSGPLQTFSFQIGDANGAADLTSVSVLFNASPTVANGCSVTYTRAQNALALLTDAGAAPTGTITPGSGSQQNSQCVLNGSGSSVSTAGTILTLNLALTFLPAFNGNKNIYVQATNPFGSVNWQAEGTWTVPAPVLGIAVTHTGNFTQGQTGAAYTVTVTNQSGASATSGVVTVTETLPSGMTLVAMTGTGWTCITTTCTRSDALAAGVSYPAIAVSVNVAVNAASPQINSVGVSGGGSASASATDSTIVTTSQSFVPIRVNAGGGVYTDSLGQVWSADTGYQQGGTSSTTASITGTSDPTLYQTEHFRTTGSLTYQFSVPNGSYTAKLKFAEIYYTSANQRVFNAAINGTTVASHLDIFAAAGAANKAYDLSFPVTVSTGQVTITLTAVTGFPKISAIEIR